MKFYAIFGIEKVNEQNIHNNPLGFIQEDGIMIAAFENLEIAQNQLSNYIHYTNEIPWELMAIVAVETIDNLKDNEGYQTAHYLDDPIGIHGLIIWRNNGDNNMNFKWVI